MCMWSYQLVNLGTGGDFPWVSLQEDSEWFSSHMFFLSEVHTSAGCGAQRVSLYLLLDAYMTRFVNKVVIDSDIVTMKTWTTVKTNYRIFLTVSQFLSSFCWSCSL